MPKRKSSVDIAGTQSVTPKISTKGKMSVKSNAKTGKLIKHKKLPGSRGSKSCSPGTCGPCTGR